MASSTTNLDISLIAASQNNKEVTANTAIDTLDAALCGNQAIALTDADYTWSQASFLAALVTKFSGSITANRNVNVPTGVAKMFAVRNNTTSSPASALVFKTGSGIATVTISDSNPHLLYSDGVGTVIQFS